VSARVRVAHTVAFADGPGGGNPCPVVFGAEGWSDEEMRAAAAEFGHETCFVLPPSSSSGGAAARLRYFVPNHEMEMCVHATVAASVLLGVEDGGRVETPLATRTVRRPAADEAIVELGAVAVGPRVGAERVAAVLGGGAAAVTGAAVSVSVARPKLLVPLADEATLDALAPDFDSLWALCDELRTTGVYAYTLEARDADVAARQFPVRAGYDEDPATGVAAGALVAWLARERDADQDVRVAQGRAMGRPSVLHATARFDGGGELHVAVGGRAEVDA
jgi:trans-2,3-dihydro-3-hydroxyanthranilate isomerase